MDIDLGQMSRPELETLIKNAQKELKRADDRERKAAIEAAKKAAQEHGFDLSELMSEPGALKTKSGKAKNPPKYKNPANPDETWSGRGRRPGWVAEAEAAGHSLEDMLIHAAAA